MTNALGKSHSIKNVPISGNMGKMQTGVRGGGRGEAG